MCICVARVDEGEAPNGDKYQVEDKGGAKAKMMVSVVDNRGITVTVRVIVHWAIGRLVG